MQLMEALDKAALKLSHYAIGNVTEWNDYWLFHPMDPDDPDTAILDPPVIKINKKTGEESLSTITDPRLAFNHEGIETSADARRRSSIYGTLHAIYQQIISELYP